MADGRSTGPARENILAIVALNQSLESLNRPGRLHIVDGSGRPACQLYRVVQLLAHPAGPTGHDQDRQRTPTPACAGRLAKRARPGGDEGRRRPDRVRRGGNRRRSPRRSVDWPRSCSSCSRPTLAARARTALSRSSRARTQGPGLALIRLRESRSRRSPSPRGMASRHRRTQPHHPGHRHLAGPAGLRLLANELSRPQ